MRTTMLDGQEYLLKSPLRQNPVINEPEDEILVQDGGNLGDRAAVERYLQPGEHKVGGGLREPKFPSLDRLLFAK